jgi:hypothetical protein
MSHHKERCLRRLAGALVGTMLLTTGVVAQTTNGSALKANRAPGLVVTFQPGEMVGREQVIRETLTSGTNEFMFVVPEGLRTEAPTQGLVALMAGDRSYYVSIRIVAPPPTNPELREALRESISGQHARMSSLEEFTTCVADREGTGFKLREVLPVVGERFVSTLWVPFKAGVLEFTLNAHSSSALAGQRAFDAILLTLRSNERGKIEIVRRSDKS